MSKAIITIPNANVTTRLAVMGDLAFIDALQKQHDEQLGFMRLSWLEPRIEKGEVIVAEDTGGERVGYIISTDKYMKREDCGLVVQLCVKPGKTRGFVGATLVKAAFERAAYGCRLFCLWCAQDIEANYFWESIGFRALAYRAGSEKKARTHIFWQKRIREGDTATDWWFPSQTTGGAMSAARLVLPIPAGRHWSEEMPVILPVQVEEAKKLEGPRERKKKVAPAKAMEVPGARRLRFGELPTAKVAEAKAEPKVKAKRAKPKNDPKMIAAAREFRDRWLEQVNAGEMLLEGAGKYDVTRVLSVSSIAPTLMLPAA